MSQPATDRNLLLGALAVRADLITAEELAAAVAKWERDGSRSLGQVLLARGCLCAEELAHLEGLVQQHLKRHGGSAAETLPEATHLPAGEQTSPAPAGQKTSRYRLLRPHAEGGLGEVFIALDEELQREVALKEIQARHADSAACRQRFLLEAEITGRLEHPGIVPVYGLGTYADGRPYYAMRFIKGDSLKDAIDRFHEDAERHGGRSLQATAGKHALELRQLLSRFVAVCNTVAYAHSKGVLHRDLKPDNVMLGNYGETLVVDWGLAKPLVSRDPPASAKPTGSVMLRPEAADSALTQAGHVLGTPQYMSPEQAAGQNAELTLASDVYSLGATLYHLLTGRAPFVGSDPYAILEGVCRGQFPPPRQVDASIPAALEAVCLKAMALRPEDRYATAKALADDVEHWLADEPVAAFSEPLRLRLARWRRRHPALVTGTAALACTVLLALGVGALLLCRARKTARCESRRKNLQSRT
jgi:serine/threonine-protein kinase